MLRRLPILIVFLLCTSCFTFFTSIEPPADADADADTPDMMVADTDLPDGTENNRTDADTNNDLDMTVVDADLADAADMLADMRDAGDMGPLQEPYVWTGAPDAPLALNRQDCMSQSDESHPQLSSGIRPAPAGTAHDIYFVPFYDGVTATAQLGWIDGQEERTALVTIEEARNTLGPVTRLTPLDLTLPVEEMALGPRSASEFVWMTAQHSCSGEPLGSLFYQNQADTFGCPDAMDRPILIEAVEAGGGFDPFFGTSAVTQPTLVWQEVVGTPSPLLVASSGGFGMEAGINAIWPNPERDDPFSIATHGTLAFFPDAAGILYSWNVVDAAMSLADGTPPEATDLTGVARGQIDIVSITQRRYVVAVVRDDAIDLDLYIGEAGNSSAFTRVGRWYSIENLVNPDAVALGTFRDGFVLWYQQRGLEGPPDRQNGWWVHPFEVAGDTLTAYQCDYHFRYDSLDNLDNDVAAWRIGDDLYVAGAVRYLLGTQAINVEGPIFTDLFAQ